MVYKQFYGFILNAQTAQTGMFSEPPLSGNFGKRVTKTYINQLFNQSLNQLIKGGST